MKDIVDTNTRCCPYCGGISAHTVITERYSLIVDFTGLPYSQADNKIVSGGKRFICDTCGRDVSKLIPTLEVMK
ncbi:hypothetical protein vBKpMFBKp34_034 [Klebsiella phage vB_KpM_FBKp34]|nr:hypothetical protein vBKpMFBKp34_034 [Klebsiella phage vB_KpM_FBKp34]